MKKILSRPSSARSKKSLFRARSEMPSTPTNKPTNSAQQKLSPDSGIKFGPYKLNIDFTSPPIHSGGCGEIYYGELFIINGDASELIPVAVKTIKPSLITPANIAAFREEVQFHQMAQETPSGTLANFIPMLYGSFNRDNEDGYGVRPYCVIELIRGGSLEKYADSLLDNDFLNLVKDLNPVHGSLNGTSIRFIRSLYKPFLVALNALHKAGRAHRDIKPENLLYRCDDFVFDPDLDPNDSIASMSEPNPPKVLLSDFGFSKPYWDPDSLKLQGTPGYFSPQICAKIILNSNLAHINGRCRQVFDDDIVEAAWETLNITEADRPNYDSPEKIQAIAYDVLKDDVYAAGVMLYELIHRRRLHPIPTLNAGSVGIATICQDTILFDDQWHVRFALHPDIAQDGLTIGTAAGVDSLVSSMLAKDPANRPSIEDVLKHNFFLRNGLSDKQMTYLAWAAQFIRSNPRSDSDNSV